MKSNENEITTHLNDSFAVPFTMTIKTIVISNQDCFDGEWNPLDISGSLRTNPNNRAQGIWLSASARYSKEQLHM